MTTFPAQPYRDYLRKEYTMQNETKIHKTCDHCAPQFHYSPAPIHANVRLCPLHAAAPRLAEALRQAVDVLDRSYRHGKLIDLNNGLLHKAIDDARSALADIEGGKE